MQAADASLRIPIRAGLRSLNVAVAAAMVLGEALRQTGGLTADRALMWGTLGAEASRFGTDRAGQLRAAVRSVGAGCAGGVPGA